MCLDKEDTIMKNIFVKMAAVVTAGSFLFCMTGCSSEETTTDSTADTSSAAESETSYGDSMVQLNPTNNEEIEVYIEYDNNYLTEDEAALISHYVEAINNSDSALLEEVVYQPYLEYLYSRSGVESAADYLESIRENLIESYMDSDDFEFDYLLVNEYYDENDSDEDTGFSQLDIVLKAISDDDITEKITSRKAVAVESLYTYKEAGGSYSLTNRTGEDQMFYLYTIDGQEYIL
jgi:hypothetical protein